MSPVAVEVVAWDGAISSLALWTARRLVTSPPSDDDLTHTSEEEGTKIHTIESVAEPAGRTIPCRHDRIHGLMDI